MRYLVKVIEVEDWVYEELEHRRRVLGYSTLNEVIIDYVIRRAPPIALERQAVEGMRNIINTLTLPEEAPVSSVIDEILFKVAEKYGFLITSIPKIEGTALELLLLRFLDEVGLEYVYKAPQVGYGISKDPLSTIELLGVPDIVYGLNGKVKGVIEVKKQERFHISEHDRLKLLYFVKKGLATNIVTTAPKPKASGIYTSLVNEGVRIFHVVKIRDLRDVAKQLRSECT